MKKKGLIKSGYLFTPKYTNYIFSLLFLLYMFDYIDRMIVTSLFPFIQEDWGISDAQLGSLVSAVYWAIVALTFPISILVDRWSRRKTIGAMATIWSLATAACAFVGSFGHLVAVRAVIGVGEAGYAPGGMAMISAIYPKEKRSWIMGLWNASIPLGSAIGVALGGIIAAKWGWRHAFGLVAIPGFIIAILFFLVKDYKTVILNKQHLVAGEQPVTKKMNLRDKFHEFSSKPALILTYFGFSAMVFVTTSLLTWLSVYFHRVYDLPMEKAGPKASIVMLLALVGAPLGGYLADRWRRKRINARLLLPGLSALIGAGLAFLAFVVFKDTIQYIVLLLLGMTITSFIPAASATTQDLIHPGMRATSYATAVLIQNLLGASTAPIVIGWLSGRIGLPTALAILPVFLLIASALFFTGSVFYKRDLEKVAKIRMEAESKSKG